jgi:hypothetical protein
MLMRLYHAELEKRQKDVENIKVLENMLQDNKFNAEKKVDIKKRLEESVNAQEELLIFMYDTANFINKYHYAHAQFLEKTKNVSKNSAEWLESKKELCGLDNKLCQSFITKFCPQRKIIEDKNVASLQKDKCLDDNSCPNCKKTLQMDDSFSQMCDCGFYRDGIISHTEQTCTYERLTSFRKSKRFTYKKINHFRETLRQAQGKSSANISKDILDKIEKDIQRRKLDCKKINPEVMKKILQRLKYTEFYEEKVYLTKVFNPDFETIKMTHKEEEILCAMFCRVEMSYEKIKVKVNNKRKNFMSYPGIARRLCEQCGWDHFLRAFPLLKDEKLRVQQDKFWQLICEDVEWPFIPTVGDISRGEKKRKLEE